MPGLEYTMENLGVPGLNAGAPLNQISNTYVGIWNLENTTSSVPVNVEFRPSRSNRSSSGAAGMNGQKLVADADVAPGGKYRSIVKLFLRYASQKASDPWMIATGWLIAPDLIVTAGHSAFDWSFKMGRLTKVKAYVGYNGISSAEDPTSSVQFQQGDQVATPVEWLRSKGTKAYNLAFITVQQPFTGIVPIQFQDTPRSGMTSLGVVGYAGDIADQDTGEKGARMYESFSSTTWNIEDSEYTMLEHGLDSYGGSSGSPVLRKDDMFAIGTHVYGGNPSLASVIGLLGSPYEDYAAAFSVEPRRSQKQADGIKYVHISITGSAQQGSINQHEGWLPPLMEGSRNQQDGSRSQQEGSRNHQEGSMPPSMKGSMNQQGGSTNQQERSTNQQEGSMPPSMKGSMNQQGESRNQQEGSRNQQEGSMPPSMTGSMNQQGGSTNHQERSTNQQEGSRNQQKGSMNQQEGWMNQQQTQTCGYNNTNYSENNNSVVAQNGTNLNNDITRNVPDLEFFEILKVGIKLSDPILGNILHVHLPIVLGAVGSPVGALAGAILSAAGKLATQSSSLVHTFRQGLPYDGILERAILGEAAFCAVMSMKTRKLEELGVFSDMARVVKKIGPATKEIAPFIMHTLTAPALRIALDALYKNANSSSIKSRVVNSGKSSFAQQRTSSSGTLDPDTEAFFTRLSARCANTCGSEDPSSNVDRILQIGFCEAGPVLTTVAYEGLQILAEILPDDPSGGEGIPAHHPFLNGLPERAMLGEAALQALIKVPAQRLDDKAFEVMAQSVARNGQVVIQSAHGLIEDIGFAVKGILAIPIAKANRLVDDGFGEVRDQSTSAANRRAKGFSYGNLEGEVLDYCRGLETKRQSAIQF